MHIPFTPLTFFAALLTGSLSAYLAFKQDRNPYFWFGIGFCFGILGACAIFFAPGKKKNQSVPIEAAKPMVIQGPADKFWYYLTHDQAQMGPMSHDALTRAWHEGKISLTTYVWNEELPDWKLLQELT